MAESFLLAWRALVRGHVLTALLALPEKYRIVLYLYGVEGYSVREIAALLRRPPNTVKTRLSRAREMLRTEWEV